MDMDMGEGGNGHFISLPPGVFTIWDAMLRMG